jgi:GntR family transcriptional regulator
MLTLKVDRDSNTPLYEQVKSILRRHIVLNELQPSDPLPTEEQLVRQLGVSRATVVKALNDLATEGVIQRIQGKGTIVANPRIHFPLKFPKGFSSILAELGLNVRSIVISHRVVNGDARAHAVFGTNPISQDDFIEFRRLRFINTNPVVLLTSTVPAELGRELLRFELENASFYSLFERITGFPVVRSEETLEIGQVSSEDAHLLNVPSRSSHFLLRGISYREGDVPLEITESIFHANYFRFQIDMRQLVIKDRALAAVGEQSQFGQVPISQDDAFNKYQ